MNFFYQEQDKQPYQKDYKIIQKQDQRSTEDKHYHPFKVQTNQNVCKDSKQIMKQQISKINNRQADCEHNQAAEVERHFQCTEKQNFQQGQGCNQNLFQRRSCFLKNLNLLKNKLNCLLSEKNNHSQNKVKCLNNRKGQSSSPYAVRTPNKFNKSLQLPKSTKLKCGNFQNKIIQFEKIPTQIIKMKQKNNQNLAKFSDKQSKNIINQGYTNFYQLNNQIQNVNNLRKNNSNQQQLKIDKRNANFKKCSNNIVHSNGNKSSNKRSEIDSKEQSSCNLSKSSLLYKNSIQEGKQRKALKFVRCGVRTQSCKPVKRKFSNKSHQSQEDQNQLDISIQNQRKLNKIPLQRVTVKSRKIINNCRDISCCKLNMSKKNCSHKTASSIDTLQLFTQYNIKEQKPQEVLKQDKNAFQRTDNIIKCKQFMTQNCKQLSKSNQTYLNKLNTNKIINKSHNTNNIAIHNPKLKLQKTLSFNQQEKYFCEKNINAQVFKPSKLKKGFYNKPLIQQDMQISPNQRQKMTNGSSQDKHKDKHKHKEQQLFFFNQNKNKIKNNTINKNSNQQENYSIRYTKRLKLKRMESCHVQAKPSRFQIQKKPSIRNSIIKMHINPFNLKKIQQSHRNSLSKRVIFKDQRPKNQEEEVQNEKVKSVSNRRKGTFYSNYSIKDMISQDYSEYKNETDEQEQKQGTKLN